jgi:hypothetical protein
MVVVDAKVSTIWRVLTRGQRSGCGGNELFAPHVPVLKVYKSFNMGKTIRYDNESFNKVLI